MSRAYFSRPELPGSPGLLLGPALSHATRLHGLSTPALPLPRSLAQTSPGLLLNTHRLSTSCRSIINPHSPSFNPPPSDVKGKIVFLLFKAHFFTVFFVLSFPGPRSCLSELSLFHLIFDILISFGSFLRVY